MTLTIEQEVDEAQPQFDLRTLMFTDVEGSTNLLQMMGDAYGPALRRHQEIVRACLSEFGGEEDGTLGDSFLALFENASHALAAAINVQRRLAAEPWPNGADLRVRIGLHEGTVQKFGGQLVGFDLHLGARIASAGHGGQVLISRSAYRALGPNDFERWNVLARPLGPHRLKDIRYPETLFDITDPNIDLKFPPIRTVGTRVTNIAAPRGPIIGRDAEIDEIRGLLHSHPGRLITITGTGGSGKTSVAERVVALEMDDFEGGAYHIDLSGLDEPGLVMASVAREMGVRDFPGRPVELDVASAIGNRRMLLILDTFEHVIDAAVIVGDLLAECPELRIIVTSRLDLNIAAEKTFALMPLGLPDESGELAEESAGVQLFLETAKSVLPEFDLTDDNRATIATIVRRLEGIPLAINLAAARLALLSPDQLLKRLDSKLKLLRSSRQDAGRHQTLRQAIDWSDGLLSEAERQAYQHLSVFAGGFRLDDAEDFLDEAGIDVDPLEAIESLTRKNLIHRRIINGVPRFGMFDMIREYAADALEKTGVQDAALATYTDHMVRLAEKHGAHALKQDQRGHVMRLSEETDNIRHTMRHAIDTGNIAAASRVIKALYWYWISQGLFTEALRWIDEAADLAARLGESEHAAGVHMAAAYAKAMAGDYAGAYPHGRDAEQMYQTAGNTDATHQSALIHAICGAASGNIEDPSETLMNCIGYMQERGDTYFHALTLIIMGEGARMEGEKAGAEECYSGALELLATEGNTFWPGLLKQNIAHFRLSQGKADEALELLQTAFDLGNEYDYPIVMNLCVAGIGGVALAHEDAETAARFLGAVEANMAKIGAAFEPTDMADIEGYVSTAKAALGEDAYATAAAGGAGENWDSMKSEARNYGL